MKGEMFMYLLVLIYIKSTSESLSSDIDSRKNNTEKTLSRKRRYLVFPEGSNLQLVYCLTMPSLGMGQIFTIGTTAALAWELPHEPISPFRKPSEEEEMDHMNRADNLKTLTSDSWTLQTEKSPAYATQTKTYYDPFLLNKFKDSSYSTIKNNNKYLMQSSFPMQYRNANPYNQAKGTQNTELRGLYTNDRREFSHGYDSDDSARIYRKPVVSYVHPVFHQVHRRTRRDLYKKIEKLLTALSRDGRACLLKAVCEVSQVREGKGTFMEEIIKVVFRAKPNENYENADDYDRAANRNQNCTDLYPSCEHSVWGTLFG